MSNQARASSRDSYSILAVLRELLPGGWTNQAQSFQGVIMTYGRMHISEISLIGQLILDLEFLASPVASHVSLAMGVGGRQDMSRGGCSGTKTRFC